MQITSPFLVTMPKPHLKKREGAIHTHNTHTHTQGQIQHVTITGVVSDHPTVLATRVQKEAVVRFARQPGGSGGMPPQERFGCQTF